MTRLRDIVWLNKTQVQKLSALGYESVERLVAVAAIRESSNGLCQILGISSVELDRLVSRLSKAYLPDGAVMSPPPMPANLLGCAVASQLTDEAKVPTDRPWLELMRKHGGLPKRVVLIREDEKIFDQGQRGTCVANAFVKVQEYEYEHQRRKKKAFSRQWLYYRCKEKDGIPNQSGTYMHTAVDVLRNEGCCEESAWPYHATKGDTEGQGPAPEQAASKASNHSLVGHARISMRSGYEEVCAALAYGTGKGGFMLAGSLMVFASSMNAQTYRDGLWPEPLPGETPKGGHAVVLAGYELDPSAPGGGWFYWINSWGPQYAEENAIHAGCFRVSFRYVQQYGGDFYALCVKDGWGSQRLHAKKRTDNRSVALSGLSMIQRVPTSSLRTVWMGLLVGGLIWFYGLSSVAEGKPNKAPIDRVMAEDEQEAVVPDDTAMEWLAYWETLKALMIRLGNG